MEQMFHRHRYAFFQEFNEFRSLFTKTIKSFMKLSLKLTGLMYSLTEMLVMLSLPRPTLYQWHSPTKRSVVERGPNNINWMRKF